MYPIQTKDGKEYKHNGLPVFGFDFPNTIIKGINVDNRTMDMIGSTEQKDRDGDILTTGGWVLDDFLKNPVFLWAHDYSSVPLAAVGSVIKKKSPEPHLFFKDIRYPRKGLFPFADMILELYGEKIIKASSVGFLPYEWEDIEQKDGDVPSHFKGRKYTKQLLLELSGCAVPSNPGALQNQVKKFVQKSFKTGGVSTLSQEEIISSLMKGNIILPEKIDDILEDLKIKSLNLIDETEAKVYQVPRSLPDNDEEEIEGKALIQKEDAFWPTVYKNLNIATLEVAPESYLYDVYGKFFDCPINQIYHREVSFPNPLVGTALKGLKIWFEENIKQKVISTIDIRNLTVRGEVPPVYDEIRLNSKEVIEAMVYGTYFIRGEKGYQDFIFKLHPTWSGLDIEVYGKFTSSEKMKDIINDISGYVDKNDFLKGEKFSLTGEFLKASNTKWDNLILDEKVIEPIKRNVNLMMKKGADFTSRGLLFAGPPGTGKTLTGRVIKDEAKEATFIWVSAKDFARMDEIGVVRMAFRMARRLAPAVIFLEDIDQWMRGYMIDVFKTEMDGVDIHKGILTILTSNSPNKLPNSLIDRPGRFHEILLFALPGKELRKELMKSWGIEDPVDELIEKSEGFSGAHLKEVLELAKQISEEQEMPLAESLMKALDKVLEQRVLIGELEDYDSSPIRQGKAVEKSVTSQLPAIKLEEVLGDNDDSFYEEILSASVETIPEFKRKEVSGSVSVEALLKLTEEVRKIKQTLNQI